MNFFGGNAALTQTAAAGTAIKVLVPPLAGGVSRITKVVYTSGPTGHTLTFARAIGRARATSATAAAGTVVNLNTDPNQSILSGNAIATNDWLAVREIDNVTRLYQVSSVSTLAITLTAGLTAGVATNGDVWAFGLLGDTDPRYGTAHPTLATTAGGTDTWEETAGGVIAGHAADEPIWVNSNNATNAGTLKQLAWSYTAG